MFMNYSAGFPGIVMAGRRSLKNIPKIMEEKEFKKAVVLMDSKIMNQPGIQELLKKLDNRIGAVIKDIPSEPSINDVGDIYKKFISPEPDLLIAIGGGSVMDMTKMISAALRNPEFPASGFTDTTKITEKGIPTVMVPTTAGTGAEATPNAIFLFPEQNLKVGIISNAFVASYVILDPEVTVSLPKALTASTGIDALCHAVESYLSKLANPLSRTFSVRAAELISKNIVKAYEDGNDLKARENMLLGSFFAGVCLFSSSTVAVHALSYPLGGKYHIPHGISNAILLPHIMEANLSVCRKEYTELAKVMLPDASAISENDFPEAFTKYIFTLCRQLQIPEKLTRFGIKEDALSDLAESALQVKRLLEQNPKHLTKEEIRGIYAKLL